MASQGNDCFPQTPCVSVDLPALSANLLWKPVLRNGKPAIVKTPAYEKWIEAASAALMERRAAGDWPDISGSEFVHVLIEARIRKRMDLDNCVKPVLDLLQNCGVIGNDRRVSRIETVKTTIPDGDEPFLIVNARGY